MKREKTVIMTLVIFSVLLLFFILYESKRQHINDVYNHINENYNLKVADVHIRREPVREEHLFPYGWYPIRKAWKISLKENGFSFYCVEIKNEHLWSTTYDLVDNIDFVLANELLEEYIGPKEHLKKETPNDMGIYSTNIVLLPDENGNYDTASEEAGEYYKYIEKKAKEIFVSLPSNFGSQLKAYEHTQDVTP